MKIVIDEAIPFIHGIFEPYAEVLYKGGALIGRDDIRDADAMIIRTRTQCDSSLLDGSPVKIIATATIGTDHIDLDYCRRSGIFVTNAAGCNAGGVMDYVFSALYGIASRKRLELAGATFGIVGAGHVGGRVADMAKLLGFKLLLCDPPRASRENPEQFCSLDHLLVNSDIVTLHVPLDDSTRGMADRSFFDRMKFGAIFINASRGEVMVDSAVIEARPRMGALVIDTWNGEPDIDRELLKLTDIATPHIAGYSYQGKQNGTAMAVRAVARFLRIESLYEFFPQTELPGLEALHLDLSGMNQGQIASVFQYNYPIFTDDFLLRTNPDGFESQRSNYKFRREFYIV